MKCPGIRGLVYYIHPSSAFSEVWSLLASSKVKNIFSHNYSNFQKTTSVFLILKGNQRVTNFNKWPRKNYGRNFINNQLGLVRTTHALIRPFAWTIAHDSEQPTVHWSGVASSNGYLLVVWGPGGFFNSRGTR